MCEFAISVHQELVDIVISRYRLMSLSLAILQHYAPQIPPTAHHAQASTASALILILAEAASAAAPGFRCCCCCSCQSYFSVLGRFKLSVDYGGFGFGFIQIRCNRNFV